MGSQYIILQSKIPEIQGTEVDELENLCRHTGIQFKKTPLEINNFDIQASALQPVITLILSPGFIHDVFVGIISAAVWEGFKLVFAGIIRWAKSQMSAIDTKATKTIAPISMIDLRSEDSKTQLKIVSDHFTEENIDNAIEAFVRTATTPQDMERPTEPTFIVVGSTLRKMSQEEFFKKYIIPKKQDNKPLTTLNLHTPDLAAENFRKLSALFPNAITETINADGKVVRAIDADVLRQEISAEVVEGPQERYQFTWPDKKKSVVLANAPIAKTLRLDRAKSVGRDGTPGSIDTENIYIEGDNLDALKLLRETYLGKVKMIYIDPPYNTGSDFIYEDDFSQATGDYMPGSGQFDADGNRLVQNIESNGRFHTDWLNMLYPRLRIAKDLLTIDGAIFISIDDNEVAQLRKMCDEIFGAGNFVTEFAWEKKKKPSFLHRNIGKLNDYILCYVKSADNSPAFSVETTTEGKKYPFNNAGNGLGTLTFPARYVRFNMPDGVIQPQDMSSGAIITRLLDTVHIVEGFNRESFRLEGEWRYSQDKLNEIIKNGEGIVISKLPFRPNHIKTGGEIKKMKNVLSPVHYQMETNEDATKQLVDLFGTDIFDNPKPVKLLKYLIQAITYQAKDSIVLDFFSGSATTAHAVMQLNTEDGGSRKFIMVQLPEVTAEKSEARKAGYETICDIGEERIRRAGKKILQEVTSGKGNIHGEGYGMGIDNLNEYERQTGEKVLDIGFRVFRVDSSNMEDVYYKPADWKQEQMTLYADNIKPDRTPEDLLFQVILDWGILLSSTIEETVIAGKRVFSVAGGYLLACFDKNVTEETVTEIAKRHPFYAVFRDSSMATDSVAANFEQIFETYSPKTERKVL